MLNFIGIGIMKGWNVGMIVHDYKLLAIGYWPLASGLWFGAWAGIKPAPTKSRLIGPVGAGFIPACKNSM